MSYFGMPLSVKGQPGSLADPEGDVARFLLVRGPYAYLGTGWVGCEPDDGEEGGNRNQTYVRPHQFDVDYGIPNGICAQDPAKPGRFVREWSKATVSHDCNTGESTIVMR